MRIKRLRVPAQTYIDYCKGPVGRSQTLTVLGQGLPSDTTFVRAGHDLNGDLWMVVQSASFPDLPDSASVIPELQLPEFETDEPTGPPQAAKPHTVQRARRAHRR